MAQRESENEQGRPLFFRKPDPWPAIVDTAGLVAELVGLISRFAALPPGAAIAIALWVMFAHVFEIFSVAPILALVSPMKRCGKTTVLGLLQRLVPRPITASNITPASLFRSVEKLKPTLLIDEADTFLEAHEELRGILNSGHTRRAAHVVRTVGRDFEPRSFTTFCPKVVAMIGELPATLADRSVIVKMRRRTPNEHVERLREDRDLGFGDVLRKLERWAVDSAGRLKGCDPFVPDQLDDRAADNWRPLLAIAELAGDDWRETACAAACRLSGAEREAEGTAVVQLLSDIRATFLGEVDRMSSEDLVQALTALEDRPWLEWTNGKPLTKVQLARLLRPLGISPDSVRFAAGVKKGYLRCQFEDAFLRYLPANAEQPEQSAGAVPLRASSEAERPASVPARAALQPLRSARPVPAVPAQARLAQRAPPEDRGAWQQALDLRSPGPPKLSTADAELLKMLGRHGWAPLQTSENGNGHD